VTVYELRLELSESSSEFKVFATFSFRSVEGAATAQSARAHKADRTLSHERAGWCVSFNKQHIGA
jgi:hypothetical protein